jgi:glycosyltransferase involved in cell wall biosynthesis
MHILFLPSWYPDDHDDIGGSFFREQAIMLHDAEAQVGVIAPSCRSLRNLRHALLGSSGICVENDNGVITYRASLAHLTPRMWRATAKRMSRLSQHIFDRYREEHGRPDIIHVHSALPAGLGAVDIGKSFQIPVVLSEHSSAFARGLVSASGLALAREIALAATACFAVSTPFARLLEEKLALPRVSVGVMPNPVDTRFLDAPLPIRQQGGKRFQFFHISSLDENKNVGQLLDSFARAFAGDNQVSLVIGGDGPKRLVLERRAYILNIAQQVRFVGRLSRPEVLEALQASDAFVLSSRFETFGVVIVEALATGLPVIATRCGGPEDIVGAQDGCLVPVDDVDAMSAAMRKIADDPTRADRSARRARCRNRFGPKVISRRWLDIYADVLAQDRRAG